MSELDSSPSARSLAVSGTPAPRSLLGLPPEVRNYVYQLVLTHPDGVLKYVPRNVAASRSNNMPNKDAGAHTTKLEPSAHNDLQFVCKALRNETHLLELKYNKLSFVSYVRTISAPFETSKSATCIFLAFFANIPPSRRDWIRNVELKSGIPSLSGPIRTMQYPIYDTKETLFRLANMCRRYPEVRIRYRFPTFWQDENPLRQPIIAVLCGVLLKYRLRNEPVDLTLLPPQLGYVAPRFPKFGAKWSGDSDGSTTQRSEDAHTLQTPNLRFYPTEDIMDNGDFKFRDGRQFFGREIRPVWEQVVKSWLEDGF